VTDSQLEADGLDHYPTAFLQHLIDNGEGWKQQGELPRAINRALEDGTCVLGRVAQRDYYNNVVPARSEVADGDKGSLAYANAKRAERGAPLLVEREDGSVAEAGS
jgi:hypothetical protein